MSDVELVWLYRFYPNDYFEWVMLEQNKIQKWKRLGKDDSKNLGVNGNNLLPSALSAALLKYGHWTNDQLNEYKMSHGHCVKSKY